jgi:Histidine kinase
MIWPLQNKALANYWLKVFAVYALTEACIQLLFFFILNNYGTNRITIIEFHFVMWFFQCLLIWPIWWVAWSVKRKNAAIQIVINVAFYVVYSLLWFGPVQDAIGFFYNELQHFTRAESDKLSPRLDSGTNYSYLNYQLLKHSFRLSWFFLAAYFYNYRVQEKKRMELAVANRELQLKLLKWHLNPSFYFKTINHLRKVATALPQHATLPILQLAKVMEYVIYEAKEKLIDVKKEIQFISNYIQLINQQPDNQITFALEVKGEYDKLKIAPLLLAGFIDNVTAFTNREGKQLYKMELQFSGNKMQLMIGGMKGNATSNYHLQDGELFKRVSELYPQKFEINAPCDSDAFKLSLRLDEQ